jgi:hypothetical protein
LTLEGVIFTLALRIPVCSTINPLVLLFNILIHASSGAEVAVSPEPCSTVPFEEDEDFTGRDEILQEMEIQLSANSRHRRVALVGPGGVG